jgi:hypothetical protein
MAERMRTKALDGILNRPPLVVSHCDPSEMIPDRLTEANAQVGGAEGALADGLPSKNPKA